MLWQRNEFHMLYYRSTQKSALQKLKKIFSTALKAQYAQRQKGTKLISVFIVLGLCNLDGRPNLRFRVKIA